MFFGCARIKPNEVVSEPATALDLMFWVNSRINTLFIVSKYTAGETRSMQRIYLHLISALSEDNKITSLEYDLIKEDMGETNYNNFRHILIPLKDESPNCSMYT